MENLARRHDPQTSYQAAGSIRDSVASQEALIYAVLQAHPSGLTAEMLAAKIAEQYRWRPSSVAVCRRFAGMQERGLIEYAGFTLRNANGRQARVMRVRTPQ